MTLIEVVDHHVWGVLLEDHLNHLAGWPFVDHDAASKETDLASHAWRTGAATGNRNANFCCTTAANGIGHSDNRFDGGAVTAA